MDKENAVATNLEKTIEGQSIPVHRLLTGEQGQRVPAVLAAALCFWLSHDLSWSKGPESAPALCTGKELQKAQPDPMCH